MLNLDHLFIFTIQSEALCSWSNEKNRSGIFSFATGRTREKWRVEFLISIHGSSWRICIGSRRQKFLPIWMYSLGDLRVTSTSSVLFSHRILWFCICVVQEWYFPQQVIFFKGHFYSVPQCRLEHIFKLVWLHSIDTNLITFRIVDKINNPPPPSSPWLSASNVMVILLCDSLYLFETFIPCEKSCHLIRKK